MWSAAVGVVTLLMFVSAMLLIFDMADKWCDSGVDDGSEMP